MAGGSELSAAFRALAEDAAQAGENVGKSISRFFEDTAEKEDASVATHMAAEEENTRLANSIRPDANLGSSGDTGADPEAGSRRAELAKMLNGEDSPAGRAGESKSGSRKLPDYIQKRIDAGNEFNRQNRPRYAPNNEIALENGKIVDSYRPNREIVERKYTQLGKIKEETAKGYIDSLRLKYKQGTLIKDSAKNKDLGLGGKKLRGKHILEVPKQDSPVPENILRHAAKHKVTIRDVDGKVYRLEKGEQ